MDVKQLPGIVLLIVSVGIILGTGLLILANAGDASRDTAYKAGDRVNLSFANTSKSLTYDELNTNTAAVVVTNGSGTVLSTSSYTVNTATGTITRTVGGTKPAVNGMYNVTYYYYVDTTATTAFDNVVTAASAIGDTWMSLLVTIIILSIILYMVLGSFGGNTKR